MIIIGGRFMSTFLNVLLVILVFVAAALVAMYFVGKKMEKKQVERKVWI